MFWFHSLIISLLTSAAYFHIVPFDSKAFRIHGAYLHIPIQWLEYTIPELEKEAQRVKGDSKAKSQGPEGH